MPSSLLSYAFVLFTRLAGVANLIAAGLTDTRGAIVQATIAASPYIRLPVINLSLMHPASKFRRNRVEDGALGG
jgi:hypothetical protein